MATLDLPAGVLLSLLALLAAMLFGPLCRRRCPTAPHLPCLPSLPVLGSLLSLRGRQPPHLLYTELARDHGALFALYLGPHYTVVVNDFRHAREVLLQRGKEFAGRPKMVTTELLSRGGKDIAFADYSPLWKSHRKLVHSCFTMFGEGSSKLQAIVCEEAASLCADLLAKTGQPLDLGLALMRAVTNVVCTLVFSSTYQPQDPELHRVMEYNRGIVQTIARGGLVDIFPWLKIFPNKDVMKLKKCIGVRDELLNRKLREHKESYSPEVTRDLLDALLKGQQGTRDESRITDDHVLMTAAEVFGAGVETTSTTLLWMIAFLLHYPKVQERIQQELDEQIGLDRSPTLEDRGRLPYLESTLCEVMRIRPVSPVLIPHVALQDTSIGVHHIPKGTHVLVNMWSIHHDPQRWGDPARFRPERFLDNDGRRISPPWFLPFGAGPRVCVGESLAKLELFLFSSWLLQQFVFTVPQGAPLPDLQGRFGVVLQPQDYIVSVTPRFGKESEPPEIREVKPDPQ
ncbi:steroid 17-alpha-hydroxylase/17,20 lyase [Brienomyrus brachyistius]|uniref:steroid 17-alpha-hydroxylase/17,20 lyase n=1 Tax=Brienomyrus brachyistius TaxID=42636 RepID=UPI0020B23342|nr:steroid 17-alpha-hydroxylase/17,20 lyase [Brienomyrus brachyistius]